MRLAFIQALNGVLRKAADASNLEEYILCLPDLIEGRCEDLVYIRDNT